MHPSLSDLAAWDRLSDEGCARVTELLPLRGFTLDRVVRHTQGGVSRGVALFRHRDGATFALVPGGVRTLGLTDARRITLDARAKAGWSLVRDEYGLPRFEDHLRAVMRPARTVTLEPLLVETHPRPLDGYLGAWDHDALTDLLREEGGLRLLSDDEWEYACAAGTDTLWRWGNQCPNDVLPYGSVDFAPLRAPNAFGLAIAHDPYAWEFVRERGVMRGGDGGDAICGGHGALAAWLTLASPYVWPGLDGETYRDGGFVRRAVNVRDAMRESGPSRG